MEYQPSFWMGLLCFLLFLGGIAARLVNQWRDPGSRFPLGGKWTLLDALGPIGFALMDIWLYQNGVYGFLTVLMVPVVVSYWELVRRRKRQDGAIISNV